MSADKQRFSDLRSSSSDDARAKKIELLQKDTKRRIYQREYMQKYRQQMKEKGIKQKQYYKKQENKDRCKEYYKRRTAITDVKGLFNSDF